MKDRMPLVFGFLNLAQGALIGAIPLVVPSREPYVNGLLAAAAIAMLVSGPSIVFLGRPGRIVAAVSCLYCGLLGTVFAVLVAGSASYLYTIYGRHGHAWGALAFAIAVIGLIVFWLIPAHELHYLRKRQERP